MHSSLNTFFPHTNSSYTTKSSRKKYLYIFTYKFSNNDHKHCSFIATPPLRGQLLSNTCILAIICRFSEEICNLLIVKNAWNCNKCTTNFMHDALRYLKLIIQTLVSCAIPYCIMFTRLVNSASHVLQILQFLYIGNIIICSKSIRSSENCNYTYHLSPIEKVTHYTSIQIIYKNKCVQFPDFPGYATIGDFKAEQFLEMKLLCTYLQYRHAYCQP